MKGSVMVSPERIQEIVEKVARKQVRDAIRPQFREELVNEAWLAILEAKQKKNLTERDVWAIARWRMIKWKLKMNQALSIPLESVWWWSRHRGRANKEENRTSIPMELRDDLVTTQQGWKDEESQKILEMIRRKIERKLGRVSRRVMRQMLEGGRLSEVWRELEKTDIGYAKKRVYVDAIKRIREAWKQELGE